MNREDVVGWIKQSGSTVATNGSPLVFVGMVDPLLVAAFVVMPRLIHPTFKFQFMERSEATKQSDR